MSTLPPVRHAVLRDGTEWGCALPPSVQANSGGALLLADGQAAATIESGCLDAGIGGDWERVSVQARQPDGSQVLLDTFTSDDPQATVQWRAEPGLNVRLDRAAAPAPVRPEAHRYLWLRLRLQAGGGTSPAVEQVQAQTLGRSYIEDLPAFYRRDDRSTRFLQRWLDLFRTDMEAFERAVDDMPQLFDPQMAAADRLHWVADCLGFEPPDDIGPAELRALLQRVPALYARRGTVAGLADWAEAFTGVRPTLIEAWHSRRVWQLEGSSRLGFDTMLAAQSPDGWVVPGEPLTDPGYLGLLRETFAGPAFDWANGSPRIDRTLDFGAGPLVLAPADAQGQPVPVATLRWTGQIRPRFAERYTLSLRVSGDAASDDVRVRWWIDGVPLVADLWSDAPVSAQGGPQNAPSVARDVALRMEAPRWYPLRLEVRTTARRLSLTLSWSSRSQRPEAVPAECLYALADERADTARTQATGFDVGQAVVGEAGPQAPGEFGRKLFDDTAHLFTVLVPPGCDCGSVRGRRLRDVIDAEKPAHTDYHLCQLKPRLRVGFQARLGIDAIVAGGPPPARLGLALLGRSSYLAQAAPANAAPSSEETPWTP